MLSICCFAIYSRNVVHVLEMFMLMFQTRVLVTHGLSFLAKADLVLVMEDGQISEMGSYLELMDRKGTFANLIHTFSGNHHRESSSSGTCTSRDKSKGSSLSLSLTN